MKTHLLVGVRCCVMMIVVLLAGLPGRAATLTLSPPTIGGEFNGEITLQINGLTNGETVLLRKYADLNGNGVIDAADMLMESFPITDGFATTVGGATNFNVPYDLTATNAAVTTTLGFFAADTIRHFVGHYLFRLSSPGGRFTPVISGFTVTNAPHAERITGAVRSGVAGLPGSIVVLLTPPPDQNVVAGTIADLSGNYSVAVPPGTYQLLAFKAGYVGNFSNAPIVVLTAGATVTTNVQLTVTSRVISGRVVDLANANSGPAGVILFSQSYGDSYALSSTDTNGVFSVGVTADNWQVQPQSEDLTRHGYLSRLDWPVWDATAGSVANAFIPADYGTAMFRGTIRDGSGTPLGGVRFNANEDTGQYETGGESDLNGNYSAPVIPGSWRLSVNSQNPDLAGYVVAGGTNATLATGQTIRADFVATRATGTIQGTIRDNLGAPVNGISIYSYAFINGANFNGGTTADSSGNFLLNVINGTWTVGLSCDGDSGLPSLGYNCTGERTVQIPPTNAVVNFVVYPLGTPSLSNPALFGGGFFQFQLFGARGTNYTVQFSTNLNSWATLVTTNLPDNALFIQDNRATNDRRFYRAFVSP